MAEKLSDLDKAELLKIAREAIVSAAMQQQPDRLDIKKFSNELQFDGASFVTLTKDGRLRGCIGALEAYQPLVLDVQEHAIAAAQNDYRFNPVTPNEVESLKIEVSHLTPLRRLDYSDINDLLGKLRPRVDGVLIKDGSRRATFLPQVWDQISDPKEFLSHLCVKMGVQADFWKRKHLDVFVYHVEQFSEE